MGFTMLLENEISVDSFAGGGGASSGYYRATNRNIDIAINHDMAAIDMHTMNHPDSLHFCEDAFMVDPVKACKGRPVGLFWLSPDCRHFSKAAGATPRSNKIRGLAWVAIRWAASVPVRTIHLENVEEFLTWTRVINGKPCKERKGETFDGFIKALTTGLGKKHGAYSDIYHALFRGNYDVKYKLALYKKIKNGLGYQVDWRILKACDYGVPTIRKRLFLVARNDGKKIRWPEITHGNDKNLKPFKTAADIIDWSIPVRSIFNRKKSLAHKTMIRIAKGIERYVLSADKPFLVPDQCVVPFITEHSNGSSQRNMSANEPLRTICASVKGGHFALVSAKLTRCNDNELVTSHMIKMRGTNIGHGTDEPIHTISAGGNHIGEIRTYLVKHLGGKDVKRVKRPLTNITESDLLGIVTINGINYQIVDIGMRMLEPHELFAANGFESTYKISHNSQGKKLSKASQVSRVGNSVPPPVAEALIRANLCQEQERELAA